MDTRNVLALTSLDAETRAALADEGSSAGCELEFVESLPAAMRALAGRRPPTAVLVDLAIEDGVKLCQSVRSKRRSVDVAIFAISQATDDRSFARALVLGADDVIDPRCNGALASRLVALPIDPSIPSVARGDALVATREAALAHLVGRVLTNAGYDVEYAHDFLALRQGSSRERMKLVVTTLDFGDLRSHVAKARDAGSSAVWVVLAAPSDLPRVESNLEGIPGTGVVSRGNPLDDILYVSNELRGGQHSEARLEQRVPFGTVVAFRPQSTTTWEHGFSWNVSATGLYVRTLAPPLDSAVVLRVGAPGLGRMLTLEGELAWQRGFGRLSAATAPPGFGVHVVSGENDDLQAWKSACQGLTRARRGSGAFRLDTAAALTGTVVSSPREQLTAGPETPAATGQDAARSDGLALTIPATPVIVAESRATPAGGQTLPFGARVETLPEHTAATLRAPPHVMAEVLGVAPGSGTPASAHAAAEEHAARAPQPRAGAEPKLDKTLLIARSGTKPDAPPPPRRASSSAFAATLPLSATGAPSPAATLATTSPERVHAAPPEPSPELGVLRPSPSPDTSLVVLPTTSPTTSPRPERSTTAQENGTLHPAAMELSSPQPQATASSKQASPTGMPEPGGRSPLRTQEGQPAAVAPWPAPDATARSAANDDPYPIPGPIPTIADSPRATPPRPRGPGLLIAAAVIAGFLALGVIASLIVLMNLSGSSRPIPEPPSTQQAPSEAAVAERGPRLQPSLPSVPTNEEKTAPVPATTPSTPASAEVEQPAAPAEVPSLAAVPSPAPTSSVPRSTVPDVTSDEASAALLSYEGHLQVDSSLPTNVYAMGVLVGRTNERLKVRCGLRFVRLGTAPGHWQSPGYTVEVGCQKLTRLRIEPAP